MLPNLNLLLNRSRSTQGHHFINLVELESPILHAKFQDHRTSGSGEEDFLKFSPYMGMAAISAMWVM